MRACANTHTHLHTHTQAEITVKEDGVLPRCKLCGMFNKYIEKHQRTEMYKKGQKRWDHEKRQDDQREADDVFFM